VIAADPPAVVQPAETDPLDVIEVVATRPGQAQKIDRRAYRVKQNPQSAQFNGIQLLRGLPAVTITPDDQVMLLGAPGVTFLVDERPIQGDPILYLRTLHGSDIERIEIMTNPSAQYASGTGGIINIVLRKALEDGLSGSANVEGSSRGNVESSTTIKKKKGKWAYELQAQGKAGRTSRSTYEKLRSIQQVEGGPWTINREKGGGHSSQNNAYLQGKVTYDLSPRSSLTAETFAGAGSNPNRGHADFIGLTPDFESFSERSRSDFKVAWIGTQVSLDHKGKKDGETLKVSAALFGNPRVRQPFTSESSDGTTFSTQRSQSHFYVRASADWVHPIGKDQILSLGGNAGWGRHPFAYDFGSNDEGRFGPDSEGRFTVRESDAAAYGTFQKRFGAWTVMPGFRFDWIDRRVSSPGRPSATLNDGYLSPTLHIEHPLTKTLNMTLSYSRRIVQAGYEDIAPYPIVIGPLAIMQGNPGVRPEKTDAYELNLHYSRKSLEVGLILYDRETDDLRSNVYTVNAEGLNVYTPMNVGHRSDRGAQFDVSTPLFKRVKGTASINLFSRTVPIDPADGGREDTMFRYTGNATVEWHGKQKEKTPGDVGSVQLTYESPSREFQFRREGYFNVSLAYTHSFSPTLSVTGNLSGLGTLHSRHRLIAPLIQETYDKREGPEFKLKLVKTLGKPN
jgi:hypothetical protein